MEAFNYKLSTSVANAIQQMLHVNFNQLQSDRRYSNMVTARVIFTHYHNHILGLGPTEIGSLLKKHHTTVIYYSHLHQRFTETKDTKYMAAYNSVSELITLQTSIDDLRVKIGMTTEWLKTNFNHPDVKIISEDRNRYNEELAELTHKLNILTINK